MPLGRGHYILGKTKAWSANWLQALPGGADVHNDSNKKTECPYEFSDCNCKGMTKKIHRDIGGESCTLTPEIILILRGWAYMPPHPSYINILNL